MKRQRQNFRFAGLALVTAMVLLGTTPVDASGQRSSAKKSKSRSTKVESRKSTSSRTTSPARSSSRAAPSKSSASSRSATSVRSTSQDTRSSANRSRVNTIDRSQGARATTNSRTTTGSRTALRARPTIGSRSTAGSRSTLQSRYDPYPGSNRELIRRNYAKRYVPSIHIYTRPVLRIRWPRIHVHISWPWVIRAKRYWAPRYRYRQVVYVQSRYDRQAHTTRVELETHYRHRLVSANDNSAQLEITIEAIDLYYEGRHLGSVDWVPEDLGRIYATVYNDGEIQFDREVFLMGDPYEGFELISTRYYD